MRCLEWVPGLPGAPQHEARLTKKFEMSHVGGATCRMTPISRSALEMNLMLDTSLKATLWGKAPNEGAMTPPCIFWKHPQVPHTARQGA